MPPYTSWPGTPAERGIHGELEADGIGHDGLHESCNRPNRIPHIYRYDPTSFRSGPGSSRPFQNLRRAFPMPAFRIGAGGMSTTSRPSSPHRGPAPLQVWFELEGGYSFGFGLIAILHPSTGRVDQAGAGDLGQSTATSGDDQGSPNRPGPSLGRDPGRRPGSNRSGLTDSQATHRRLPRIRDRMVQVMETSSATRPVDSRLHQGVAFPTPL